MSARTIKTVFVGGISILFILILAHSAAAVSYASSTTLSQGMMSSDPSFVIFPEWEWFDGHNWPDGTVYISVANKDVCTTSGESSAGFFNGGFPEGCDIVTGDEVTFTQGEIYRLHTIIYLGITEVDATEDTVSGTAQSESLITAWSHNGGQQLEVAADLDGIWQVDFTGNFDLEPDNCGRAQISDGQGNGTAIDWCVPRPRWDVFPETDLVELHRWEQGVTATASISGKDDCIASGAPIYPDWEPSYRNPYQLQFPEGCDVSAGDLVSVTNGTTTLDGTVQYLEVLAVNEMANTVSGKADVSAPVHVWLPESDQIWPTVDSEGNWTADFANIDFDLQPGMNGRAQIDTGDTATAVDWLVRKPIIVGSTAGDWFWVNDFVPGMLNIAIYQSYEDFTNGYDPLWSDPNMEYTGGIVVYGNDIHGQDLVPGSYLVVSDGIYQKSLVLELITMEVFDTQNDIMAGTAPSGSEVSAAAGPVEWQQGITIQADPEGNWLADFGAIGFDITEDMRGGSFAQIIDEDGDASEASVPASLPTTFRDDFNGDTLTPGWHWQNGDLWEWSLGSYSEEPGFLRLTASDSSTPEGNLLLRQIQQGNFSIETRFYFEPDTNFQFAGLVIFQDAENFLQLGRAFCDVEGGCVGNGLYFDKIENSGFSGENFATPLNEPAVTILRLERSGERIRAFFSTDEGMTWYEIGTHWILPDFQVNGVGLVASQDSNTPDTNIIVYFDYFELNEGWGFLPEGFHDSAGGDVPRGECNANGWATDQDDFSVRLNVEIVVDDVAVDSLVADDYRQDLAEGGVCVDGSCSFATSLWDKMSSYEPHRVDIWAQDFQTGEWVLLSNSAKTVTCRTYDIYSYDPLTGATVQITDLRDTDEYNPSWSPNGKKMAHDVLFGDGSTAIYITDVKTGLSIPLEGAEFGNDAVWSQNGKWIAFDNYSDLYLISPLGGSASLITTDAVSADWAPNGKRIVFQRPSDQSIRTVGLDGEDGPETLIAVYGANPTWSPDGNWIAYEYDGDIWKVQVSMQGEVLNAPVQVTSGPFWDGQPTWSPDSLIIVYHSGFGQGDWDIWSVPAAGGTPTWLTGAPGFGDYDPSNAKNSSMVSYASFSPEGQAARDWIGQYTYDPPDGTWTEGVHSYQFRWEDASSGESGSSDWFSFTVSDTAPDYDGHVLLRYWTLTARTGDTCINTDAINSSQPTRFYIGWISHGAYQDVKPFYENMTIQVVWDDIGFADEFLRPMIVTLPQSEWFAYNCTFTAGD